ncbi:hypothetical protein [Burkholderia sp. RS02]|uniref:hypothetical protein n=1 Tax=unclassified Burkholderia TaxID=2613784 RepID=UPI0032184D1B
MKMKSDREASSHSGGRFRRGTNNDLNYAYRRLAGCGAGRAVSANEKRIRMYRGIVQDSDHVDWCRLLIRQAPAGKFLKWLNRGFADSPADRRANQGGEIGISRFKKPIRTSHICRIGRAERERISGRHKRTTSRETVRTAHPASRKIEWKRVIPPDGK